MPVMYQRFAIISLLLVSLAVVAAPPRAAAGLFDKNEMSETERQETLEKIEAVQEKLRLLQDKLRALERRKAIEESAEQAAELGKQKLADQTAAVNWLPVDNTLTDPGDFGLYTYLLFVGEIDDEEAIGRLEDFILTIETLPETRRPAGQANRFLVPVERPQSTIALGRRPYDFRLNRTYLARLGIAPDMAEGLLLVSTRQPVDPYADDSPPAFLAVSPGPQPPQEALALAKLWHEHVAAGETAGHPVADLFWVLIDGEGPVTVTRDDNRLIVEMSD